mgnify:CR=1 FL=1
MVFSRGAIFFEVLISFLSANNFIRFAQSGFLFFALKADPEIASPQILLRGNVSLFINATQTTTMQCHGAGATAGSSPYNYNILISLILFVDIYNPKFVVSLFLHEHTIYLPSS